MLLPVNRAASDCDPGESSLSVGELAVEEVALVTDALPRPPPASSSEDSNEDLDALSNIDNRRDKEFGERQLLAFSEEGSGRDLRKRIN